MQNNNGDASFNLEKTLQKLEQIISSMEKNSEMNVEDALIQYQQGIELIRDSQAALQQIEQKVRILNKENGLSEWDESQPETADSN